MRPLGHQQFRAGRNARHHQQSFSPQPGSLPTRRTINTNLNLMTTFEGNHHARMVSNLSNSTTAAAAAVLAMSRCNAIVCNTKQMATTTTTTTNTTTLMSNNNTNNTSQCAEDMKSSDMNTRSQDGSLIGYGSSGVGLVASCSNSRHQPRSSLNNRLGNQRRLRTSDRFLNIPSKLGNYSSLNYSGPITPIHRMPTMSSNDESDDDSDIVVDIEHIPNGRDIDNFATISESQTMGVSLQQQQAQQPTKQPVSELLSNRINDQHERSENDCRHQSRSNHIDMMMSANDLGVQSGSRCRKDPSSYQQQATKLAQVHQPNCSSQSNYATIQDLALAPPTAPPMPLPGSKFDLSHPPLFTLTKEQLESLTASQSTYMNMNQVQTSPLHSLLGSQLQTQAGPGNTWLTAFLARLGHSFDQRAILNLLLETNSLINQQTVSTSKLFQPQGEHNDLDKNISTGSYRNVTSRGGGGGGGDGGAILYGPSSSGLLKSMATTSSNGQNSPNVGIVPFGLDRIHCDRDSVTINPQISSNSLHQTRALSSQSSASLSTASLAATSSDLHSHVGDDRNLPQIAWQNSSSYRPLYSDEPKPRVKTSKRSSFTHTTANWQAHHHDQQQHQPQQHQQIPSNKASSSSSSPSSSSSRTSSPPQTSVVSRPTIVPIDFKDINSLITSNSNSGSNHDDPPRDHCQHLVATTNTSASRISASNLADNFNNSTDSWNNEPYQETM